MEARPIGVNKKNSCSKLLKPVMFHGRLFSKLCLLISHDHTALMYQ